MGSVHRPEWLMYSKLIGLEVVAAGVDGLDLLANSLELAATVGQPGQEAHSARCEDGKLWPGAFLLRPGCDAVVGAVGRAVAVSGRALAA